MKKYLILTLIVSFAFALNAQVNIVEGYVYEDGNRGFLNQVAIEIVDKSTGAVIYTGETNKEGFFGAEVPINGSYVVNASKQIFVKKSEEFKSSAEDGEKKFVKIKMQREPGYDFEVTLAPKRDNPDIQVDAITGAWIEVYNNTTKKEVLNLKDHPDPDFDVHFDQGNHYTIMIRKDGFLTKRMEAYVNVEGCILCFDGVGNVQPGVTDNLSDENSMGVLLANVELDPLFDGKTFTVENIFYDLGKATLRKEAKKSLEGLALVIKDNPQIKVELGAHTDSRGTTESNLDLSKRRAKSAVEYLVNTLDVSPTQIISAGFGEQYLRNGCSDGVDCSEKEHQENRRTEIRVLNIDKTKKNLKTLEEIRIEEEFLKSIFDGEVDTKSKDEVKEEDGLGGQARSPQEIEQIEKEIKAQEERKAKEAAERAAKKKKDNEMQQAERKRLAEESKMNEQKLLAEQEAQMKMQKEKMENEKMMMEAEKKRMVTMKEAEEKSRVAMEMEKKKMEEMNQVEDASKRAKEVEEKTMAIESEERKIGENGLPIYEGDLTQLEKKPEQSKTIREGGEFMNPVSQRDKYLEFKKAKDPMFNYNGYKIVVHFSDEPISVDSDVFKRHTDLMDFKTTNGTYLYLIGDFKNEEDAEDFLIGRVLQMYPGAYIVGFRNGRRLN